MSPEGQEDRDYYNEKYDCDELDCPCQWGDECEEDD